MRWVPIALLLALALGAGAGCPGEDDDDAADDDTADDDTGDDDAADDDTGDDDTGDDDTASPWEPYALLSLNLHCLLLDGTSFATNEERFEAIAAFAAAEGVEVIALQEVCHDDNLAADVELEAYLEWWTAESWSCEAAFAHVAWEGTPDEADEHVALLVQGELQATALTYRVQAPLTRVELSGQLGAEHGGLRVTSVHLEVTDEAVRTAQARESVGVALQATDGVFGALVMGDFNAMEGSPPHEAFLAAGYRDLSGDLDATRIDHALAHRGAALEATQARLVFDGTDGPVVSDHPGVLIQVQPAVGAPVSPTRFLAQAAPGPGHGLWLRGDAPPLDWGAPGWPAVEVAAGEWQVVMTEIAPGPFEYKWLRDDEDWQLGGNEVGEGQTDHVSTPVF